MKLSFVWEEHRRFLLVAGAGLVVFCILYLMIDSYDARAAGTIRRVRNLEQQVQLLARELRDSYGLEKNRADAFTTHETALSEALCLPRVVELDANVDRNTLQIRFQKAISDVWSAVRQDANRVGIALPEPLDLGDFSVAETDGPEEFRAYYSYLSIVKRTLELLVAARVKELSTPEPLEPERIAIEGNPEKSLLLRGVVVDVRGSYDALRSLLSAAQSGKPYLQVRLQEIGSVRGTNEEGLLDATVELVGFEIVAGAPASGTAESGARTTGRRRRASRR